jgi:uncharacterized membrane protein
MDKDIEKINQETKELRERMRQDAMHQFKGKQLENILKKVDELTQPLEDYTSEKSQTTVTKTQFIAVFLFLILGIPLFGITTLCLDSVLFFNDKINWIARYIMFPFGVLGGFYLNIFVAPRRYAQLAKLGIKSGLMRYSPVRRYLTIYLSALMLGVISSMSFYLSVSVGMNFLNTRQIRVNTNLIDIHKYRGQYKCRVLASRDGREIGALPSEETISLFSNDIQLPLNQGDKILLIGRKSFAGIIIDRIQKAP